MRNAAFNQNETKLIRVTQAKLGVFFFICTVLYALKWLSQLLHVLQINE